MFVLDNHMTILWGFLCILGLNKHFRKDLR